MNATIMIGLQKFLEDQLQGDCQNFPGALYDPSQVECGDQKWQLDKLRHGGRATIASIRSDMNNLATAVTNCMRMMEETQDAQQHPGQRSIARGRSVETTVCTDIHWYWLTLPTCLIGATAGSEGTSRCKPSYPPLLFPFLPSQTARSWLTAPFRWKFSLLPLLFYRVRSASSDGANDAAPAETQPDQLQQLRHLRKQANQTMVQLKNGENG